MLRIAAALGLVVTLALPSVARADAPVAWQRKALAEAQRVWKPSCGALRIQFAAATPDVVPESDAAGWAAAGNCALFINRAKKWLGYPHFCDVVLHEAGHAAGLDHAKKGIMAPVSVYSRGEGRYKGRLLVTWEGVDRRCLPRR